ncbi:MAG: cell wall-active antibiotics response protein [Halanaerobiaceae bacterium]|nr:cell wall-active antibiotics response protein [Halanaerobiaceae bacterium]
MRSSFVWGILIVLIGLILLLNNIGITDFNIGDLFSTYWPLVFIILGLDILLEKNSKKSVFNMILGTFFFLLGIAIIGRNLDLFDFDFSILWNIFWPLLLILIGINIVRSGAFTDKGNLAILSGIERKQPGWKLESQNYLAIMGGIELDLRAAEIPEGETHLEFTAIMGGIDIRMPEDVNVICNNTTILGGIDFFQEENGGIIVSKSYERKAVTESRKTIIINSNCIMGGIEIK